MLKSLWMDESGAVVSAEIIIILTILVCGLVVGVSALRDALVTELADVGAAIAALDQTYSFGGAVGHHAACSGSAFADAADTCDDGAAQAGVNSRCIALCVATITGESGTGGDTPFTAPTAP